jgi:hypothetical protein
VGDVEDRRAGRLELADDLEQPAGLALGQRRGRLVEQQHAHVRGQRLRQLHLLALGHAELRHRARLVHREPDPVQVAARLGAQAPPVDRAEPRARPAPHHHVLGHRALGHQAELLVDDADAARAAVLGVAERHLLPVEQEPAAVRAHRPGDHLHQGRLAGPVLPEQGVHFAGVDAEVDPGECLDPRVALLDALGVEQRH